MSSIFNINKFKNVVKGLQRSSLFTVDFTFPSGTSTSLNGIENLSLVVSAAKIPESKIHDMTVSYMGRRVHFSGNREEQGQWQCNIILDNDWSVYKTLYHWNAMLNGPVSNTAESSNAENLKATATVSTYTTSERKNGEWTLYGVWVATIAALELNWESDNALTPSVTFYYDYAYPTRLNNSSTSFIKKS